MNYLVKYTVSSTIGDDAPTECNEMYESLDELLEQFSKVKNNGFDSSCIFNLDGSIEIRFQKIGEYSLFKEHQSVDYFILGTATPVIEITKQEKQKSIRGAVLKDAPLYAFLYTHCTRIETNDGLFMYCPFWFLKYPKDDMNSIDKIVMMNYDALPNSVKNYIKESKE